MAYTINRSDGTQLVVLDDGTIDTSTSLTLVGRNYIGYGEVQNENFVYLLENFSNDAPPSTPIIGQLWFDKSTNVLKVYDSSSKWEDIGSATLSDNPPQNSPLGSFWLKTTNNTLYVWTGTAWAFIGPEDADGYGTTAMKSGTIVGDNDITYPIVRVYVNGIVIGIVASNSFTIKSTNPETGFTDIVAGFNISSAHKFIGTLQGNSTQADRLTSPVLINGTAFDGSSDVTIKSETKFHLKRGNGILGQDFDGSQELTWSVDASSTNTIGKIVQRDSGGDFEAGTITANLVGNVTGNVTASSGTSTFDIVNANSFVGAQLTGNASTATRFVTPRNINGVSFDGTADVTVPAEASTLTGTALPNTVITSNVERVGTLISLDVQGKITLDNNLELNGTGSSHIAANDSITFKAVDPGDEYSIKLISNETAVADGVGPKGGLMPLTDLDGDLGKASLRFDKVYAQTFVGDVQGNITSADTATKATNLAGGVAGSVPYQTGADTTAFTSVGVSGYVLTSDGSGAPYWGAPSLQPLTFGNYLDGNGRTEFPGNVAVTLDVDASTTNTANKIVARDGSGNFAAGVISASLSGNADTATRLATSRNINGVAFDGSGDITITASDPNAVTLAGVNQTMSGSYSLLTTPSLPAHLVNKSYVDNLLDTLTVQYAIYQAVSSFTNQVGSFNFNNNFFYVYPPSGKTMADFAGGIVSISEIHFAGGVDANDSLGNWFNFTNASNNDVSNPADAVKIRVRVQNTEQRAKPRANYLFLWRN